MGCYIIAGVGFSLSLRTPTATPAMASVFRYTVSPPRPAPAHPAATPRPRETGHILVPPARPLRYVSPSPLPPRSPYTGPAMVFTVPPLRRSFGYTSPEPIPTTFPGECPPFRAPFRARARKPYSPPADSPSHAVPDRPRRPVQGYED